MTEKLTNEGTVLRDHVAALAEDRFETKAAMIEQEAIEIELESGNLEQSFKLRKLALEERQKADRAGEVALADYDQELAAQEKKAQEEPLNITTEVPMDGENGKAILPTDMHSEYGVEISLASDTLTGLNSPTARLSLNTQFLNGTPYLIHLSLTYPPSAVTDLSSETMTVATDFIIRDKFLGTTKLRRLNIEIKPRFDVELFRRQVMVRLLGESLEDLPNSSIDFASNLRQLQFRIYQTTDEREIFDAISIFVLRPIGDYFLDYYKDRVVRAEPGNYLRDAGREKAWKALEQIARVYRKTIPAIGSVCEYPNKISVVPKVFFKAGEQAGRDLVFWPISLDPEKASALIYPEVIRSGK